MTQPKVGKPPVQESASDEAPHLASVKPAAAKRSSPVKQILKILFSLSLIAFILYKTGFDRTIGELSRANLWYIPLCIGIYLAAQFISTYRWKFLAKALDFKLSMRELYDYYLIGMFCNQFLPGSIGGDAVRMYYMAKSANRKKREAFLTVFAERGVGLVAILILTAAMCLTPGVRSENWVFSLPMGSYTVHWDVRLTMLALAGLGIVGYSSLWILPLERWMDRYPKLALLRQAKIYWSNIPLLAGSIGVSLVVQAIMIGTHVLIAQALHMEVSPLQLAVVYGMVSLASVLPLTQGGLGVREAAYQVLLMRVGVPDHTGLAFGVYWFAISTLTSLIGGLVMMKGHYKTPSPQETEDGDAI